MAPSWLAKMLGQEQQYEMPTLPPGERVQQTLTGSVMSGRRPGFGAQIVVGQSNVGLAPVNTAGAQKLLGLGARAAGVSGWGAANSLINLAKPEPVVIPRSTITSVSPGTGVDSCLLPPFVLARRRATWRLA